MTSLSGWRAAALTGRHRVTAAVAVGAVVAASTVATVIGGASAATAVTTPTGPVIFTITTNNTSDKAALVVVGAINAKGVDIEGQSADVVKLGGGTIKIGHASAPTAQHDALNKTTCVDLYTASGKFTIAAGTGVYKGLTGQGTYNVAGTSHFKRVSGKCDENVEPITSHEVILATGMVK